MKTISRVQSLVLILATAVVLVGPLARGPADAQTAQQDEVEVTTTCTFDQMAPTRSG